MEPTLFTKIITGDIPSHKVYEDEKTFAFLDIFPAAEGHTLVVPKAQIEFIWDLADDDYQALMATVKKVGERLRSVTGKKYAGTMVVGTDVLHAHVHVVAFNTTDELKQIVAEDRAHGEPDHASLAAFAKKLAF